MVDVGEKEITVRSATAEGRLMMELATLEAILEGRGPKGDPLRVAELAGIQAAKLTPYLIPLCHPLPITGSRVEVVPDEDLPGIRVTATVRVVGKTGVEMEALSAVMGALLTTYDMLKAIDRGMQIEGVRLLEKKGGRSGDWDISASE